MQASSFMHSGGSAYGGQVMPPQSPAQMAPPQAYAAQVCFATNTLRLWAWISQCAQFLQASLAVS